MRNLEARLREIVDQSPGTPGSKQAQKELLIAVLNLGYMMGYGNCIEDATKGHKTLEYVGGKN